jgi:hypothetical protein
VESIVKSERFARFLLCGAATFLDLATAVAVVVALRSQVSQVPLPVAFHTTSSNT